MVGRLKLPDTEFLVLTELAERAGKTEEELLVELVRDAAWQQVTNSRTNKEKTQRKEPRK